MGLGSEASTGHVSGANERAVASPPTAFGLAYLRVRRGAKAVKGLCEAGAVAVMLTGDNEATARCIASELGIQAVAAEVCCRATSSEASVADEQQP